MSGNRVFRYGYLKPWMVKTVPGVVLLLTARCSLYDPEPYDQLLLVPTGISWFYLPFSKLCDVEQQARRLDIDHRASGTGRPQIL